MSIPAVETQDCTAHLFHVPMCDTLIHGVMEYNCRLMHMKYEEITGPINYRPNHSINTDIDLQLVM